MKRFVVIGVMAAAVSLVACEGDSGESCESICLAAQAQSCTTIDNCYEFCDVAWDLSGKAGCRAEYNAYHSCAQSTATCSIDAMCASQENAMFDCAVAYCYANPNDADCVAAMNL